MKVLVIEDHPVVRDGLKAYLPALAPGLEVDDAANCAEALELARTRTYGLVLLDLNLPGVSGIDALFALRQALPEVPLVVVSGEERPDVVHDAIEGGAMGFIPKSSNREVLIDALRQVFAGKVYVPPAMLDAPVTKASPAEAQASFGRLTPRQKEVLRWLIQGKPNKSIARELNISESTAKAHVAAVMQTLGANNRTQVVFLAAKLGMPLV